MNERMNEDYDVREFTQSSPICIFTPEPLTELPTWSHIKTSKLLQM